MGRGEKEKSILLTWERGKVEDEEGGGGGGETDDWEGRGGGVERVTKLWSGNKWRCCSGDLTEGEEEWELQTLLCLLSIPTDHRTIERLRSNNAI